jgi:hypothetical protein
MSGPYGSAFRRPWGRDGTQSTVSWLAPAEPPSATCDSLALSLIRRRCQSVNGIRSFVASRTGQ